MKKGVQYWNKWRLNNPRIITGFNGANLRGVDLSGANLREVDLSGANLREVDLSGADLFRANLNGANLSGANLIKTKLIMANLREVDLSGANLSEAFLYEAIFSGAILSGANLNRADLRRVDLRKVDLREVDLSGANLSGAFLSGAILSEANLREVDLREVDLSGANLNGANLNGANLSRANLSRANLSRANLSGLDLSRANLSGANLSGANLSRANLSRANLSGLDLIGANLIGAKLIRTQVLGTDFTGAKFTGACLEDWNINSATKLNDIDCQYVYLKNDFQERRPSIGEFRLGEFTKLFQKALETVDLIFTDGIDWKAFLLSFQELQAEYGEENLSVQAFEKKSGGAFVVRLEVLPEANKAEIECRIKELYEVKLNALEGMYRKDLQAKNEQIIIYKEQSASIMSLAKEMATRPIQNIIDVKATSESSSMSESYQSKYDQKNANIQFVDTAQTGSKLTFNQQNFSQNINQSIDDITRLINSLREKAQEFPQDKREEVLVHLDDLQEDINKPEKQKPERIKARIFALITIAGTVFGVVANSADFTNNVLEIADKLGIPIPTETSQPQRATQQLPPPSH
nr:pentapeptide repeat-containing protein [Nostoc sp. FACHB-888]